MQEFVSKDFRARAHVNLQPLSLFLALGAHDE